MSPDELTRLVRRADGAGLAAGLSGMDEAARRILAPVAYSLYRSIAKGEDPGAEGALEKIARMMTAGSGTTVNDSYRRLCTAGLAVLGCCSSAEAKRVRFYDQWKQVDALVTVLIDRRPAWASTWLNHCMDTPDFPLIGWKIARRLIVAGVCARPNGAGYVREMVSSLLVYGPKEPFVPLSSRLLAEPDLLETEIWRLFEVETAAFASDWRSKQPNARADYETWPQALLKLVSAGTLDRGRLLDASLDALWVMENGTVLGNMCRFHALLVPTVAEEDQRAERYAELLRHRTGHVVGFALSKVAILLGRGRLNKGELLPRLAAVFELKAKSHALAALKLLARHLDGPAKATVWPVLGAALRHPHAEVQSNALAFLAERPVLQGSGEEALLRENLDDLAPSVRVRAEAMLPATSIGDSAANDEEHGSACWPAEPVSLPAGQGNTALEAELRPPLRFAAIDRKQLTDVEAFAPVADVESLIDLAAHLVETVVDSAQVEQLMEGISRLCADRPQDFAARSAALSSRLRQSGSTSLSQGIIAWAAPTGFRNLLQAWLQPGLQMPRLPRLLSYCGPVHILQNRLRELAARVARGVAAPLLATPTHRGGWVSASALVERLLALQARGIQPLPWDYQQALLRLAPDDRRAALSAAETITGTAGRVLSFALGADPKLSRADRSAAPLWVAAARARWPEETLSAVLAPLDLPTDWPDLTIPAHYTWRSEMREVVQRRQTQRYPWVAVDVTPPFPRHAVDENRPFTRYWGWSGVVRAVGDAGASAIRGLKRLLHRTADSVRSGQLRGPSAFQAVLAHEPLWRSWRLVGYQSAWSIEMLLASQPLQPDPLLAGAVPLLLARIDLEASPSEPNHPFLLPLLPASRPWSEMGRLVLCLGLVSRDANLRSMAVDILSSGLADGRGHPDELAPVLVGIASGGWMKRNRLGAALKVVAGNSACHALAVIVLIERFLHGCGSASADDLPLLEVLHEQTISLGRPVNEPMRAILAPLAARTGKSARLAQVLLATDRGTAK